MIRTEFTPDSQGSFKDRQKEGPGGLALTTLETVPPGKGPRLRIKRVTSRATPAAMNANNLQPTPTGDSVRVNSAHSGLRLPDSREELLQRVRDQYPELQPEDAFVVPTWFVQERKWVEDPAGSDTVAYNYPLLLRIRGPLNEGALEQSLQEIIRRHGVLRSVFRIIDERLIQIVLALREFSLPITHLDGLPETREQQMLAAAHADAMRPFDLTQDSIVRAKLVRLQTDDHVLQLTTHTLVFDDWSSGVLIRELSETYCAFTAGTIPPRCQRAFQFGDFVRWHRDRLQGPEFESHLGYWKQQMNSETAFAHLATDFARPVRNTNTGARKTVILPEQQADSLKGLSRDERVSLFMVLLAGFNCLLHRYSGHEEIGVATCAANRPLEEVEGLIGRFGNSVLLRTSLSGSPTFSELFKRLREVTLQAFSHQELPFGMLLETIAPGCGRSPKPPFQVMFILQNAPKDSWQLSGLSVDWAPLDTGTSKYDLIVWLKSEPAMEITLEYSTQVFKPESMDKLMADYLGILETMVKNPKERVGNLQISTKPGSSGVKLDSMNADSMNVNGIVAAADKARVESRMIELWQNVFRHQPIDAVHNFFELGGDSLMAARLFTQINKTFQCNLPLTALLQAPTIRQLVQMLCGEKFCSSASLVSVQPHGTRPPLFFAPGSGGEPVQCWKLSGCLGPDQPLYGLRSRGLCGEPLQHTIPEMAAYYVQVIRDVQPDGPYYLSGYCFGGLVVYEMAQLLTAQGQDIALLALFDTPAPGFMRVKQLNTNFNRKVRYEMRRLAASGIGPALLNYCVRSLGFFRRKLRHDTSALGDAPARPSSLISKPGGRGLDVSAANIAAAEAYYPGQYAGRIALFSTREFLARWAVDQREGWLQFAAGGIENYTLEAGHDHLFEEPSITNLAEELKRCIERTK
jgi:thioesterase domain-containing protein/acyl carrier protein